MSLRVTRELCSSTLFGYSLCGIEMRHVKRHQEVDNGRPFVYFASVATDEHPKIALLRFTHIKYQIAENPTESASAPASRFARKTH